MLFSRKKLCFVAGIAIASSWLRVEDLAITSSADLDLAAAFAAANPNSVLTAAQAVDVSSLVLSDLPNKSTVPYIIGVPDGAGRLVSLPNGAVGFELGGLASLENYFYLVPAGSQEYSLVAKVRDGASFVYKAVDLDGGEGMKVVGSPVLKNGSGDFADVSTSLRFQLLKNPSDSKSFYLRKASSLLSSDEQDKKLGFVSLKVVDGAMKLVFGEPRALVLNDFTSLAKFTTAMDSIKSFSPDEARSFASSLIFILNAASSEGMPKLATEAITFVRSKFFNSDLTLKPDFASGADNFAKIMNKNGTSLLGSFLDKLSDDQASVRLLPEDAAFLAAAKVVLVTKPAENLRASVAAAELRAREMAMQTRINNAKTFADFALVAKDLANPSIWFVEGQSYEGLLLSEDKVKSSGEDSINNLKELVSKISNLVSSVQADLDSKKTVDLAGMMPDMTSLLGRLRTLFSVTLPSTIYKRFHIAGDLMNKPDKFLAFVKDAYPELRDEDMAYATRMKLEPQAASEETISSLRKLDASLMTVSKKLAAIVNRKVTKPRAVVQSASTTTSTATATQAVAPSFNFGMGF